MVYYVLIRGPLGCGKSTVSRGLSKVIHAKYFAVDRILDEYKLTKDTEEGYISQKSFINANDIIAQKAKYFLGKEIPVVFDGNFYWKSQIDDLIRRLDFQHYVFTLKAPLDICIKRDIGRKKSHGRDAAEAVYKKSTEFKYGTEIDVTKPLDKVIEEIISYLPK